jgi:hypothetical protein
MTQDPIRVAGSIALLFIVALPGCGGGRTADARIDAALAQTGSSREVVFPLSGKITVDGLIYTPAKKNRRLVVKLYRGADSEQSADPVAITECKSDGSFAFEALREGDGVKPGDYVITFADLIFRRKDGYREPDGFNNLYNNPAQNERHAEFRIDHHAPGRTDYEFDLRVAGETPIDAPAKGSRTKTDR